MTGDLEFWQVLEDRDVSFEDRLAAALQPIRFSLLAQVLFHCMDNGWFAAIRDGQGATSEALARRLDLNLERFRGLLHYLENERIVVQDMDDSVRLTPAGEAIQTFEPWYMLLVGGYGRTFSNLPSTMRSAGLYADRSGRYVGIGSCGISQFDALPMTRNLLTRVIGHVRTVVDIGCGDGSYLLDLCQRIPEVRGIGIEMEAASVQAAHQSVRERGLTGRVVVKLGKAATETPELDEEEGPFCFITAFVLQEILEQSGRDAVLRLLKSTFSSYRDSRWIVVEVDHRPKDQSVMGRALGLAYYNPYYLVHVVTEQSLETLQFWEDLFAEAGLEIVATERPDPAIDSLGLKVGFLLAAAG